MLKIVIVEDEYAARTGVERLIGRLGEAYQVVGCAENGHEGLLMVREHRPDVMFTDIRMPRMSGLEMMQHLRETGYDCRFVILSGYAEFEYAQKGMTLGATDYLLKPITVATLRALLERLEREIHPEPEKTSAPNPAYSLMVSQAVDAINRRYSDKLSLESLAASLSVTPEYLSALFSKETGRPFVIYLREVRIEHAKELLRTSGKKVYEIAFDVGYPDVKYFCRVFKEATGVSAREYARGIR